MDRWRGQKKVIGMVTGGSGGERMQGESTWERQLWSYLWKKARKLEKRKLSDIYVVDPS